MPYSTRIRERLWDEYLQEPIFVIHDGNKLYKIFADGRREGFSETAWCSFNGLSCAIDFLLVHVRPEQPDRFFISGYDSKRAKFWRWLVFRYHRLIGR